MREKGDLLNLSPLTTGATRRRILLAVVFLIGAVLRFGGVDGSPEDWDSLDFLLGTREFDLIAMQPHLPGYPLYMLLARLICLGGPGPAFALELLGAAAGAVTVILAYLILSSWTRPLVALQAAALLAVQPALVAESPRMHSDTLGLLVTLLGLLLVVRARVFAGGVCSGLALGIRLAYAPLVAGLILFHWSSGRGEARAPGKPRSRTGRLVAGVVLGLAAWGAPFLVFHGPELLAEGGSFLRGHFFEWGGTPLAAESPGLVAGVLSWVVTLARVMTGSSPETALQSLIVGLTGVLAAVGCVACAVGKSPSQRPDPPGTICWLIAPYVIWLLVGQSASSFRHALPAVLFLTPMVAIGWSRWRGGSVVVGIVVFLYAVSSTDFLLRSRGVPAPADALALYLDEAHGKGTRFEVLYCGASYRFLGWRGLHQRLQVTRAIDFPGVIDDVNSRAEVPSEVLVSSDVERIPGASRPMVSFTAPGYLGRRRLDLHRFRTRGDGGGFHGLEILDAERK